MSAAPDYGPLYAAAGAEWNVDPRLLQAVAGQEGGGVSNVSPKGALGHMQFMPDTAKEVGITDPNDVQQSIYGGAKYLSQLLDRYKSPELALAAYNAGPGRVDQHLSSGGKVPLPAETLAYVPGVTKRYVALAAPAQSAAQPAAADPVLKSLGLPQDTAAPRQPAQAAPSVDPFNEALGGGASQPPAASQPANAVAVDPFNEALGVTPPAAAPAPASAPTSTTSQPTGPTGAEAVAGKFQRIGGAVLNGVTEGFGSEPLGLNPNAVQGLRDVGIYPPSGGGGTIVQRFNEGLINPLSVGADALFRVGAAGLRGAQGAVAQFGAEVGAPQLGRDIAAMPEAFATGFPGHAPVPAPLVNRLAGAVRSEAPAAAVRSPLADEPIAPVNRLAPGAPQEPSPGMGAPSGGMSAPASDPLPRSVGAAASTSAETNMSPKEIQAYRSTAEGQKLLEPQQPGIPDRNVYVPGVTPNAAELEQSVNTARELKALNVTAPAVSAEAKSIAHDNNEARREFFQQPAGSPVDVMNARDAASAQAKQDLAATFGSPDVKPADVTPVVDTIQGQMSDPRGKQNTQLNSYIKPLVGRLVDADGTPKITDPQELYGFREDVNRMLSKESVQADPKLAHVKGQLSDILAATDKAIEQAAPGYQTYLDNYSAAMRRVDEMTALQEFEPKLYDAQNRMTYNKVQTMMRQIVDSRMSPGNNPYKSISDETMNRLWALRDDLRRSARALADQSGS